MEVIIINTPFDLMKMEIIVGIEIWEYSRDLSSHDLTRLEDEMSKVVYFHDFCPFLWKIVITHQVR